MLKIERKEQTNWVGKVDTRPYIPSHFNPNRDEELAEPGRIERALDYVSKKSEYIQQSMLPADEKMRRQSHVDALEEQLLATSVKTIQL